MDVPGGLAAHSGPPAPLWTILVYIGIIAYRFITSPQKEWALHERLRRLQLENAGNVYEIDAKGEPLSVARNAVEAIERWFPENYG